MVDSSKIFVRSDDSANGASNFADDRDGDDACRSLWVAVIEKAIKDMAYVQRKRQKDSLTPSEREKLNRIYELDPPESFFDSDWFEDICLLLEIPPTRIRTAVTKRYLASLSSASRSSGVPPPAVGS